MQRLLSCSPSNLSLLFLITDIALGNMFSKEYENKSFYALLD